MKPPLSLLISFAEGAASVEKLLSNPEWRVVVDSGAFANFNKGRDVVPLPAYVEWLKSNGSRCWRYFNLDVIANPEASRANFERMVGEGLDPIPVFQRGGKAEELVSLCKAHRLVAVGGVAAKLQGDLDYIHQVMNVARDYRDKIHLLGVGTVRWLVRYRPFSCDSSTYCSRHGFVRFWDPISGPGRGGFPTLRFLKGTPHLDLVPVSECRATFARYCDEYGIDPEETKVKAFYTSYRARVVNLRAYMRYQATMRRMGVEYFIAMSVGDVDTALPEAWALERDRLEAAA